MIDLTAGASLLGRTNIEKLQQWLASGAGPGQEPAMALLRMALDEIINLRAENAQLHAERDGAVSIATQMEREAMAAREQALDDAIAAVEGESLGDPQPCEGDEAYGAAIHHAVGAVRALKTKGSP